MVHATVLLNLILLVLMISPSISVVAGHIYAAQMSLDNDALNTTRQDTPKVNDSTRPDIYYIIPDSYPSDAWLNEAMGFDNSAFTQALRDRDS